MHIDENKRLDKRNVGRSIEDGVITQKDYEIYLSRLPDVSEKVFNLEESAGNLQDLEPKRGNEIRGKKRAEKKKAKGKGK
jgi:hypothetical protein